MSLDLLTTQIVSGILTGGAGAVTSLLGGFRNLKSKVTALEDAVGRAADPRSGLYQALWTVEDSLKKLRRDIDSWEDAPPNWATRLLSRARGGSSSDLTSQLQFEEHINQSLRTFNERLSRFQDETEEALRRLEQQGGVVPSDTEFVSKEEYTQDSRMRAEEMARVRENIATANGLLRGVMASIGMIDPEQRPKPPRPGGR
jgi:hypothetical protein